MYYFIVILYSNEVQEIFLYQASNASCIPSPLPNMVWWAPLWFVREDMVIELSMFKCLFGGYVEPLGD